MLWISFFLLLSTLFSLSKFPVLLTSLILLESMSCFSTLFCTTVMLSEDIFFFGVSDNEGNGNSDGCGATTKLCLVEK